LTDLTPGRCRHLAASTHLGSSTFVHPPSRHRPVIINVKLLGYLSLHDNGLKVMDNERPLPRMTPQRQAVLDAVRASDDHPRASEIYDRVRRLMPGIAFGTVYNALNTLAEQGIIRQLTFGDAASRFDARVERHDHVVCTQCGNLADVHASPPAAAVRDAAKQTGFAIHGHHTQLMGLCAACREQADRR
jgi:Fur family peroxide stress response transcriptional regulator